ncbi:threonine dehydratase [Dendrobium catenatum]|uniref:Threonine dehydratase n=1 Tax=Dendrobium catenatum TaxID=906689 RepID=A0A2I0VAU2_9ASPA|nr:threonine dehydratase [Dendrobium catenatum]
MSNISNKIWVFWKPPITIDVLGDHPQVLHCKVEAFNVKCFASFVYAASSLYNRKALWESLIDFHSLCNLPWLVGGDFNAITCISERRGGSSPSNRSMDDFNNMILSCNLIDIGFVGDKYTWNRGHLWQRLDRVLFNDAWINYFNCTKVQHLTRTLSDHSPLLININIKYDNAPSQFRFQNMWLLNNSFLDVVQTNWNAPLHPDNDVKGMIRLWFKLKRLQYVLTGGIGMSLKTSFLILFRLNILLTPPKPFISMILLWII